MASVENLSVEVASRLNAVVPEGVRVDVSVDVSVDTKAFAIFSTDGWWGTQGLGITAAAASPEELAEGLEVALSGIQDAVAHITNSAWPALEDGELPIPWASVSGDELQLGFGRTLVLPPIPLSAL